MSENKKALSIEDLESVAGGLTTYEATATGGVLKAVNGRPIAEVASFDEASKLASRYGFIVTTVEAAGPDTAAVQSSRPCKLPNNSPLSTKSPM